MIGTPRERFEAKVHKTSSCWYWTGRIGRLGYGQFWLDGRQALPHRFSYELHVGPIPEGLQIDHLCRNRACVNPEHLEPVTAAVNTMRAALAKGTDRCDEHGPKFIDRHGHHICKPCRALQYLARKTRAVGDAS